MEGSGTAAGVSDMSSSAKSYPPASAAPASAIRSVAVVDDPEFQVVLNGVHVARGATRRPTDWPLMLKPRVPKTGLFGEFRGMRVSTGGQVLGGRKARLPRRLGVPDRAALPVSTLKDYLFPTCRALSGHLGPPRRPRRRWGTQWPAPSLDPSR